MIERERRAADRIALVARLANGFSRGGNGNRYRMEPIQSGPPRISCRQSILVRGEAAARATNAEQSTSHILFPLLCYDYITRARYMRVAAAVFAVKQVLIP